MTSGTSQKYQNIGWWNQKHFEIGSFMWSKEQKIFRIIDHFAAGVNIWFTDLVDCKSEFNFAWNFRHCNELSCSHYILKINIAVYLQNNPINILSKM